MTRAVRGALVLILVFWAPVLRAQHPAETRAAEAAESPSAGEHGSLELWKWANFAVLVGALGYVIAKNGGPFFAARSREIRKGILEAEELRADASARLAAMEARLERLAADVEGLRREAQREEAAESERLRRETAAEIAKIQAHAEQEIASAAKAARLELKRYTAGLAIQLAEQQLRSRMTPANQQLLVSNFVNDLRQPVPPAQRPA